MGNNGVGDGRKQIGCTVYSERRMGGNGAFVWCGPRKVYRLSENTLDFLKILYRLFSETL